MNKQVDTMMNVEVWSDLLCPFCYIGKRKFEEALAQFANKDKVTLVWKSFQLDPSIGNNVTISYSQHLQNTKGWTAEQTADIISTVSQRAAATGIDFRLEKACIANSFKAHCLSHFALEQGKQNEIEEALFRAHFCEGKNIGETDTLVDLAETIGLHRNETIEALGNPIYAAAVTADIQEAMQLGISGVPFFVFNRRYAVSGAQEESVFSQTLLKAFTDWSSTNNIEPIMDSDTTVCKTDGTCD
jgi:predicted DsbA family dithiol-disulfide isomerase